MVGKWMAAVFLRVAGWKLEGSPEIPKAVAIAAPHTSNWDGVFMVAMAMRAGLKLRWLVKKEAFKPAWGWFLRLVGGLPIDRSRSGNVVDEVAATFRARESLWVAVPASGTRSKRPYWKSGFYHIARGADVPIVLCFLDYGRKVGGFGPVLHPTGDIRADMDVIRAFYADKQGKHPEKTSRIRLRAEDELDEAEPKTGSG